jgi:hypothetical protein
LKYNYIIIIDHQKVKEDFKKKLVGEVNWCFKEKKMPILENLVVGMGNRIGVENNPL